VGIGGDRSGELQRRRQQPVVFDDPRHQSHVSRLGGVDHPTGEQQLRGVFTSDELRQPGEAGDVTTQPSLDEQLAEPGAVRGDTDVGHHRQLHPPADCGTVDGCDHGDVGAQETSGGRGQAWLAVGPLEVGARGHHHLLDVVAGTERRVASGDHQTASGRGVHGVGELSVGGERQGVAGLGTVDRDDPDVAVLFVLDLGVHAGQPAIRCLPGTGRTVVVAPILARSITSFSPGSDRRT
jgi:hypothetical protein